VISKFLAKSRVEKPDAIGHRVVHGGSQLRHHCRIDDMVLQHIKDAVSFAPLHLPTAVSVMELASELFPGVPQVACFDTAFHSGMPEFARTLPLPKEYRDEGVEKYGFHGISCESILHQLGEKPPQLIIAHLGNGASVTAVKNGVSVDTSMGLTPAGGLIMGTRSGDLDPGVLLYLAHTKKLDPKTLDDLINHRSGLLGISGVSGDMRHLHEAASANPAVKLAINMFGYALRKQLAAMIAVLNGVDTIVFTGGIGENDPHIRAAACEGLSPFGVLIDNELNAVGNTMISHASSRTIVRVIKSDEDERIAYHTHSILLKP
jgi:acetate kinase